MSMDRTKRIEEMHDSLVHPDKTAGLIILPGQMPFKDIMVAKEPELDEYIAACFPAGVRVFKRDPPYPKNHGRRMELKRFVLARLHGFEPSGKRIQDEFDFVNPKKAAAGADLAHTLEAWLDQQTTQECRDRIKAVRKKVAREAGALVLSSENQKIMNSITLALTKKRVQPSPPLTHLDILNVHNLPHHDTLDQASSGSRQTDIATLLQAYLLVLTTENPTWDRVAAKLGMEGRSNSLKQRFSAMITARAKEILRRARGYNPILKSIPSRATRKTSET